MFFLNLRTADPSIVQKIFGPENTPIFYAIPARRTRTHSVVRQGCNRIHAELIGSRKSMTRSEWWRGADQLRCGDAFVFAVVRRGFFAEPDWRDARI
jgi:hypothetical protein